jgi:hypothetical protein
MKIKLLLLIVITATASFGGDILRINNPNGTWQDFEISNIAKLTFSDFVAGDLIRVNNPDGTWQDDSLSTVDKLRFSDWYGFLAPPQNLTILADSSSVSLDWDLVSEATDYLIYRSETDPYTGFAKIDSTDAKPYQDNSVLAGNKYFYMIKARNSQ